MKIAFYFNDENLSASDFSHPQLGNPGVGGTQYCLLLLMYQLRKAKQTYQLTVYHYSDSLFPEGLDCAKIYSFENALRGAELEKHDFLIMTQNTDQAVWRAIERSFQQIIFWGHNFYYYDLCRWISNTPQVVANVFVGRQLYDYYIDDDINLKSTYIFNMVVDPINSCSRCNDSRTVVYMGALIPAKGFLLLARMWKSVLKKIPDAKLNVLGSGKLYNSGQLLGDMGIADRDFEKEFLPYLTDKQGKLLDSVNFVGIAKENKYNIFLNASVGVVNPSARTETFGLGIIEMATAKLPCVTLRKNGHIDTIKNGQTGFLCKSQREIKDKIVYLLQHSIENERLGEGAKAYAKRFSPEVILPQWICLFEHLQKKRKLPYLGVAKPYISNFKWLFIVNRFIRFTCRLKFLPSVMQIEFSTKQLRAWIQKQK